MVIRPHSKYHYSIVDLFRSKSLLRLQTSSIKHPLMDSGSFVFLMTVLSQTGNWYGMYTAYESLLKVDKNSKQDELSGSS